MEETDWGWGGEGRTGSCSDGQGHAQLIFNPIFYWWAGLCSLPVVLTEAKLSIHASTGDLPGHSQASLAQSPTGLQSQIPWQFSVPLLDPQVRKSVVGSRT